MIKYAPVVALALLLAACQESAAPAPPQARPTAAVADVAVPPAPAIPLPRYVGRWAARKDLCPRIWTRLWVDELLTSDQLRCQIMPHSAAGGDRKLRMICIELAKRTREEWRLHYPAPDRLKLQRGDRPAQSLVRC